MSHVQALEAGCEAGTKCLHFNSTTGDLDLKTLTLWRLDPCNCMVWTFLGLNTWHDDDDANYGNNDDDDDDDDVDDASYDDNDDCDDENDVIVTWF